MKNSAKGRIVLVGFSASGKTTVGRVLAERLGWRSVDVDEVVEGTDGRSITEIIRVEGEQAFRAKEKVALKQVLDSDQTVIAVGGGALLDAENRDLVQRKATVINLSVLAETATDRVVSDENGSTVKRPLVASSRTRADVQARVVQLMNERKGVYDIGALKVVTDYAAAERIAETVAREFELLGETKEVTTIVPMPDSKIVVGRNVRNQLPQRLQQMFPRCRTVGVVVDRSVWQAWESDLQAIFSNCSARVVVVPFVGGEQAKRLSSIESMADELLKAGLTRSDVVIGIGGGVIGDMTGLLASLYMRGLGLVHLPTTIVAQVDSAIGGKTGVNLAGGKNLLGTFREGDLILTDPEFLSTLPEREYIAGLAEVVKYGLIESREFFEWLVSHAAEVQARAPEAIGHMVEVSSETKARFVRGDLSDLKGLRALLNFGHTIGHALEQVSGYSEFLHGEAISIGMVKALAVGERLGKTPTEIRTQVVPLLRGFGLPTELPSKWNPVRQNATAETEALRSEWRAALCADKKRVGEHIQYVVLEQLGKAVNVDVDVEVPLDVVCEVAANC